jgi:hypothetical protein
LSSIIDALTKILLICSSLEEAASRSDYVASNDRPIVGKELERMRKKAAAAESAWAEEVKKNLWIVGVWARFESEPPECKSEI